MKKQQHYWLGLCLFVFSLFCVADEMDHENSNKEYADIYDLTAKHEYQFTRKDVDIVKKLIWSSLNILEGKFTLSEEIYKLGPPFEGGVYAPKKFFDPIREGRIINYHTFTTKKEGDKTVFFEGIYGTFLKKRLNDKYWDFARVSIWVDGYGEITHFLDSDFAEFNLTFKDKFFFADLTPYYQSKYGGLGKNLYYAIYRFDRVVDKIEYRFYFCINRDNYDENAIYPYKWGSLAIERVDPLNPKEKER